MPALDVKSFHLHVEISTIKKLLSLGYVFSASAANKVPRSQRAMHHKNNEETIASYHYPLNKQPIAHTDYIKQRGTHNYETRRPKNPQKNVCEYFLAQIST